MNFRHINANTSCVISGFPSSTAHMNSSINSVIAGWNVLQDTSEMRRLKSWPPWSHQQFWWWSQLSWNFTLSLYSVDTIITGSVHPFKDSLQCLWQRTSSHFEITVAWPCLFVRYVKTCNENNHCLTSFNHTFPSKGKTLIIPTNYILTMRLDGWFSN